jgi:hypothetical protein
VHVRVVAVLASPLGAAGTSFLSISITIIALSCGWMAVASATVRGIHGTGCAAGVTGGGT